jgi:hypothetical protein
LLGSDKFIFDICSTHGGNDVQSYGWRTSRDHIEDLQVNERTRKQILRAFGMGVCAGFNWLRLELSGVAL